MCLNVYRSKQKQFTIEEKAIVNFCLKKGEQNSNIANELDIGHYTISYIWQAQDKIEQEFQKIISSETSKLYKFGFRNDLTTMV